MHYQIRSNDVVIGHADLGFGELSPRLRFGSFRPNDAGRPLMEHFADITRAHRAYRDGADERLDDTGTVSCSAAARTLYADIQAAHARAEALELRLHLLDGTLIPTEYITIRDTQEVLAFNTTFVDDEGNQRPWESTWESGADPEDGSERGPSGEGLGEWRYQISVDLRRCDAIP